LIHRYKNRPGFREKNSVEILLSRLFCFLLFAPIGANTISARIGAMMASARWGKRQTSDGHNPWKKTWMAWRLEMIVVFSISALFAFLRPNFLMDASGFSREFSLMFLGAFIWMKEWVFIPGLVLLLRAIKLKKKHGWDGS
jgi:membrane glycosyltransferase